MKKIIWILIVSLIFLASCGKSNSTDIINPDAEYLYFFGATCPHCQELNRMVEEEDLFSKIAVEKREVYFNNTNRDIFLKLVQEIQPERDGVPFVYDKVTWQVAVGVEPAFALFKSRLNTQTEADTEEVVTQEVNSWTWAEESTNSTWSTEE